jgi:hypothetical protein
VAAGDACVDPLATCAVGYFTTEAYATNCTPCTNAAATTACPVGQYQTHDASGACNCAKCPPGTHAMTMGAVGRCTPCPTGTHQAAAGTTSCDYCPAGTASNAIAATSAGVCTPCGYGFFSSQGAPVCSTCPGNHDATGATCPAGTYRKNTQIDCACTNCPAGTQNPSGATSATSGRTSCDKCPTNTFAADVGPNVDCKACAAGKHAPELGAAYCRACSVGTAFEDDTKMCKPCSPGHFQNVAGQTACKKCPCGKAQAASGATHCNQCSHGTGTATAGSDTCTAGVTSCAGAATVPTLPTLNLLSIDAAKDLTPATAHASIDDLIIFGQNAQQVTKALEDKAAADKAASEQELADAKKAKDAELADANKAAEQQLAAAKEAKDAVIDAERLRHVAEIRNSNATSAQCKLDLENAINVTAVLDHSANALNTTVARLETDLAVVEAAKVTLEQAAGTCEQATKALEDKAAAADQKLAACESKTVPPTVAPQSAAGTPLTDSSAAHEGYVCLDIDGNHVVDINDAISLFVATTMRSFGAGTMLDNYRSKHPAQHVPTRTVDQIMALTNEADAATTKR